MMYIMIHPKCHTSAYWTRIVPGSFATSYNKKKSMIKEARGEKLLVHMYCQKSVQLTRSNKYFAINIGRRIHYVPFTFQRSPMRALKALYFIRENTEYSSEETFWH